MPLIWLALVNFIMQFPLPNSHLSAVIKCLALFIVPLHLLMAIFALLPLSPL
jgi:hypothetical protein